MRLGAMALLGGLMGGVVGGLLAVAAGPFLLIWSLNTLFTCGIPYTVRTWAAALALEFLVSSFTTTK